MTITRPACSPPCSNTKCPGCFPMQVTPTRGSRAKSLQLVAECLFISPTKATFPAVRSWYKCLNGYGSTTEDERKGYVCRCNQVSDAQLWRVGGQCGKTCPGYVPEGKIEQGDVMSQPPPPAVVAAEAAPVPAVRRKRGVEVTWAYGLTTVGTRRHTTLPRTLASLEAAGFPSPHLFVDGDSDGRSWEAQFLRTVTARGGPPVRTFGNWVLTAVELYLRNPTADRYAVFQDDFVTCLNLREYLEACEMPQRGYWNLYTFPKNANLANGRKGFYPSDQLGKGAVALVFDRPTLLTLVTHPHMRDRPLNAQRGWRSVDGGIVSALRKEGYTEFVHAPSLTQHIGHMSSMGNRRHPDAPGFVGEGFDAKQLIG